MNKKDDPKPPQPHTNIIAQVELPTISHIISNLAAFDYAKPEEEEFLGPRSIPVKTRDLCQAELATYGISPPSFIWSQRGITAWDKVMLEVVVKHWLKGYGEGAFANYAIEEVHCNSLTIHGLAERWLRGQKDQIRKPKCRNTRTKPRIKNKVCLICSLQMY